MPEMISTISDSQVYGLWNSLIGLDSFGRQVTTIPAHDGDFFPESPLDYVAQLRKAVQSGLGLKYPFWPVRVDIDITQSCTDNCYFCYSRPYHSDPDYTGSKINPATFSKLISVLARNGTRSIRFTGGGDPLLHPDFESLVNIVKSWDMKLCVLSNGSLLNERLSKFLADKTDHIRLSLNASTDPTRNIIHRTRHPEPITRIFKNIQTIADLKSNKSPLIWTTFLILPENIHEIRTATERVLACGADSISYRPIYHGASRPFTPDEKKIIETKLRQASAFHNPPEFCVYTPNRDIHTVWDIHPATEFNTCISAFLRTVVETTNNGLRLKVCGLHRGSGGQMLGEIDDHIRFDEIWRKKFSRQILYGRPGTCSKCIDISMNKTLNRVWQFLCEHPEGQLKKNLPPSNTHNQ